MSSAKELEQHSATKQALLRSAKELFTSRGYSAVSTRELAESAGVNLGAIKYHFESKANLFVQTIISLMAERKTELESFFESPELANEEDAGRALGKFVEVILFHMCHPEGPDACRMMHREINGATSEDPELYEPLLQSVTEEFIRPLDSYLLGILKVLAPNRLEREQWLIAQSIIGQCAYYVTHRPFAEKLRQEDLVRKDNIREISNYITQFSLRGIGIDNKLVQSIVEEQ